MSVESGLIVAKIFARTCSEKTFITLKGKVLQLSRRLMRLTSGEINLSFCKTFQLRYNKGEINNAKNKKKKRKYKRCKNLKYNLLFMFHCVDRFNKLQTKSCTTSILFSYLKSNQLLHYY